MGGKQQREACWLPSGIGWERDRRTILEEASERRETALQRKKRKEKDRVRGTSEDGGAGREALGDRHTVGQEDSEGERLVRRERRETGRA